MLLTITILICVFGIVVLSIGRWVVVDESCTDTDTMYSIICWSALLILLLAIR